MKNKLAALCSLILFLFFPSIVYSEASPLAYTKSGNIWLYEPESGSKTQITFDGSYQSRQLSYYSPMVSFDGVYVAYESSTSFFIYSRSDHNVMSVAKYSSPDILADTLLGWDVRNNLYFTHTYGDCLITSETMKGPDQVVLYRYHADSQQITEIREIPKVEDAPHAYSIGKEVSPDGYFISFYGAACSAGYGEPVVFMDLETGVLTIDRDDIPMKSLEGANIPIEIDPGYSVSDRSVSPDGRYIAYLEYHDLLSDYWSEELSAPQLTVAAIDALFSKVSVSPVNEFGGWSADSLSLYYSAPTQSEDMSFSTLNVWHGLTGEITRIDEGPGLGF